MIYITVTGTCHYYGQEFIEAGTAIHLIKEPDNEHDREAIRAEMDGLGKIGYVANSPHTVLGESHSAGRLYDKIPDTAKATVLYVLPRGVLCTVNDLAPIDGDDSQDDDEAPSPDDIEAVSPDDDEAASLDDGENAFPKEYEEQEGDNDRS